MAQRPSSSLKHEYGLFVEREIESYKESVPRLVLLSIGDEAVQSLAAQRQLALTELLLCDEVDRIIAQRIRLPKFVTWKARKLKLLAEQRRPEHWGIHHDDPLVRVVSLAVSDTHVLLACEQMQTSALYCAAHGCDVTALAAADEVQRVMDAAEQAGLGARVHASVSALDAFTPDTLLTAVIYSSEASNGLDLDERGRMIGMLKRATAGGGVHVVHTMEGTTRASLSLDELQRNYQGWNVSIDQARPNSFFAQKSANDLPV